MKILCLCLLFLCGCDKPLTSRNITKPQIIRTCLRSNPSSLDPRKGVDMPTQGVNHMLHAGLVYLDRNLELKLDLLRSYQALDNYTKYIFLLKDCHWSDGSSITAKDFELTWKEALTPFYASANTNLFHFIKNARAASLGEISLDQVGIHAIDDKTLLVELEKPNKNFLNILTNQIFAPVHQSMRDQKIDYTHLISSGPFQLDKYMIGNQITLKKNPYYWDGSHIQLEQIHYYIIGDPYTSQLMFEKGEVDWIGEPLVSIPTDSIPSLKQQGVLRYNNYAGGQWLFLNTEKVPFNNVHIRKALAYAIDRKKIATNILHLEDPPLFLGLIPQFLKKEKWHPWFPDGASELAQQHLQQGLKELGLTIDTFPTLHLSEASSNGGLTKSLEAIQQMWYQNLGIKIKIESQELPVVVQKLKMKNFEMARTAWVMQYDDPGSLLEIFKKKNIVPNYTGWEHPGYIQQAEEYQSPETLDPWSRIEEAERILFDEMPSIPLLQGLNICLEKPYVKGMHINHLLQVDFRHAYIEDK